MERFDPEQENLTFEDDEKIIYSYCGEDGAVLHESKVLFKKEKRFLFHPYSVARLDGSVIKRKIRTIELIGWDNLRLTPKDIKTAGKYGFGTLRIKQFFRFIYGRYKHLEHVVIGVNIKNELGKTKCSFNWPDLEPILKEVQRDKYWYDRGRKTLINNSLSKISPEFENQVIHISGGQLSAYLSKFTTYHKVNKADVAALSNVLNTIPPTKISITDNFIKTKNKINKIFFESVIESFEKLMSVKTDNEKQWQRFFEKNTWLFSHLFPFEAILKGREVYVGGKTLENKEGRVVDFLFANSFQNNFALLEIKTHNKKLLKPRPYRAPSVFAYSDELSGGIGQCLDQKDKFIKDFGAKYKIWNPKTILVIGNKAVLNDNQLECFELLRNNQQDVIIVTFDELLAKLKGLLLVMES